MTENRTSESESYMMDEATKAAIFEARRRTRECDEVHQANERLRSELAATKTRLEYILQNNSDLETQDERDLYTREPLMLLTTPKDIQALYYADGSMCSPRDMVGLCLKHLGWKKGQHDEVAQSLGQILYHTFRNTHEWARHSLDRVPLRDDTRGVGLKQSGSQITLQVFDSGPGFARRILDQENLEDISWNEEIEACLSCFKEGVSSAVDVTRTGSGLPDVVKQMKKWDSAMQVHTGRVRLHQNHSAPEGRGTVLVKTAPVVGTSLTFHIRIP